MGATDHERAIRVLKGGVGRQNGVVRFDDGAGQLRSWIHAKLQFGFFAIVGGEAFHQESTEPGTGSATKGVENEETLKSGAVIGQTTKSLHDGVDKLLSDGIMAASICKT